MDPALLELYEEGSEDDEVSVILRLSEAGRPPPDVRVVASFPMLRPTIVTARCRRRDIRRIHDSEEVVSMKAGRRVVLEQGYRGDDDLPALGTETASQAPLVPERGTGVVVGICDWGFDFTHANFRNPDGTTRFISIWDQGADHGDAPAPYGYGRVHTRDDINRALATPDPCVTLGYQPSKGDPQGNGSHGTHVLDILAGNRREPGSQVGLASDADIVCVDLATERMRVLENFGDSVRLLEGLDFLRNQAGPSPLVMHLSAGKTGGTHDWTGCFERAVDALLLERSGIALVQSVGNYGESRMHVHGQVPPQQRNRLDWLVSSRDRTANELEVWYSGHDEFGLTLVAPNGARFDVALGQHVKLIHDGRRWGTLYHRKHEPNSGLNHIDIFLRAGSPAGHYRVELRGLDIVDGRFHAWIERDAAGPHQSRFPRRQATSRCTTNTICNSYRGIAVGACDATLADRPPTRFTSSGPTADGRQKPELAAPGYRIVAARSQPAGGWGAERRLTVKSGTSMAAPWVSGTVALMMQAAGRPLTIAEVRRLLIGATDPIPAGPMRLRLGYGYLNVAAAVEAARRSGSLPGTAQDSSVEAVAPHEVASDWTLGIVDAQPFDQDAKDRTDSMEVGDAAHVH